MSYTHKYLKIDLTTQKIEFGQTEKKLIDQYIGAKGMGFALLNRLNPSPAPFDPENPLIFINGPFTGTKMQTSARTTLVTRSPLTGCAQDCHCGGSFGPRLKFAGYDYIYITGKAEKPVYIYIYEDKVKILDAAELWGKGIFYTNDELKKRHSGIDPRIAAIGPAGESLSKISCIGIDKHRQFGRGGVGAVMGSKNLKAIVVDGNIPIKYFDEEKFKAINLDATKNILNNPNVKFRRQKGTMKCIRSCQTNEILPVKNWQKVQYEEFEKLSSETTREELNWEDTGCYNCSIRCSKWARWDGHEIEGPEYETTAFLGSSCEISNIKDIAFGNEICNDLGLDTISAGGTVGFAMECYEKGLLENTFGLQLDWGNAEAQRELLHQMSHRKGLGKVFADGTREAALKIGKGSLDFAIQICGMELSGINPKGSLTMGVAMAVADFASHTRLWIAETEMGPDFKVEDILPAVFEGIDTVNVRNSMVICDFVPLSLAVLAEILNAATGSKHTAEDLLKIGARINHLSRAYNLRNGRSDADDTLPERFFSEESLAGFMKGKKMEKDYFKTIIHEYYKMRKWDAKGAPTAEVLKEFEI
ncbi:MAG: aldehyde ferredoxin oxidoreductase family protein [Bacteroidales bacterium]|jgi:aldehyde:ferredoxin oxidoreductase|nr:aldehyde ferredoxin oxidoreductase family protein [Bacteroidales bacterium]